MVRIHLSKLMGELRITQKALHEMTGIRLETINLLYHELAASIKFEHIELICKALNCNSAELIEYIPEEKMKKKKE